MIIPSVIFKRLLPFRRIIDISIPMTRPFAVGFDFDLLDNSLRHILEELVILGFVPVIGEANDHERLGGILETEGIGIAEAYPVQEERLQDEGPDWTFDSGLAER